MAGLDPAGACAKLLPSWADAKYKARAGNGTTSVFNVPCPFGCGAKVRTVAADKSAVYIASDGMHIRCAACSASLSVIDLACRLAGLDPGSDRGKCAELLRGLLSLAPLGGSQGRGGIPGEPSAWGQACKQYREWLAEDTVSALAALFGDVVGLGLALIRESWVVSGIRCPWGCGQVSSLTVANQGRGRWLAECQACGQRGSLLDAGCRSAGLDPRHDSSRCATYLLGQASGFTGGGAAGAKPESSSAGPSPTGPASGASPPPEMEREWCAFGDRLLAGDLSRQERLAIRYIEGRGIPIETAWRHGLYVRLTDGQRCRAQVVQLVRDRGGRAISYQHFCYEGRKPSYRCCKAAHGPAAAPWGIQTCSGKDGPILMVAGFMDGPSALVGGVSSVLNAFSAMYPTRPDLLRPAVEGRSVLVLFDNKKVEAQASYKAGEVLLRAGAERVLVLLWGSGVLDDWDVSDQVEELRAQGQAEGFAAWLNAARRGGRLIAVPVQAGGRKEVERHLAKRGWV